MMKRTRRKTLIISKLQVKMIVTVVGLIIAVSVCLVFTQFLVFRGNILLAPVSREIGNQLLRNSILPVVIIAVVLFALSLWTVIIISHRIYGPLYRFGLYIKKLCEGEITEEITFRKYDAGDGLKEIYDELRIAFEKTLHYDYKEMADIFTKLQNILDRVHNKKIRDKELSEALQNICDRIAEALDITSDVIESDE
jgi:hypothetical protein